MRRRFHPAIVPVLLMLAAGCSNSKITPIGPGYVFQPNEKEQRLWQTCEQDASGISASGHLYPDPALTEYVNAVLQRLLGSNRQAYLPLKIKAYVVDSPVVNAFALPEGEFFVHSGALGRLRNEAQLAMLLGHELTHATHRHGFQECERAYAQTAATQYVSVLSTAGGGNIYRLVSRTSQVITQAAIMGYSRDKEREADRVGLVLIAQAGYDPHEGARMFHRMMDAADPKQHEPNFLYATHPKDKERVVSCQALITEMPQELLAQAHDVGTDRYLKVAIKLVQDEVQRHIAQGKYALADETVKELMKERSDDANSHALAGELCRARGAVGDPAAAREAYSRALKLDPSCPMALRGLGMICLKDGAKTDALRHLKAYVESAKDAPDRAFVQQTVEQLEHEQGVSK